jgi:hypothetical protein
MEGMEGMDMNEGPPAAATPKKAPAKHHKKKKHATHEGHGE